MYERRKSQVCTRERQPQQWCPNNRPLAGMDKRQCDLPQRRALSGDSSSGDPSGAPATSFKNCQGNRRNSDGADCERCGHRDRGSRTENRSEQWQADRCRVWKSKSQCDHRAVRGVKIFSGASPNETDRIQNGIDNGQDKTRRGLLTQCRPRCTRDREEERTRDGKAHHEGDESSHVLIVHSAPEPGEIAKQQAGKDRDQRVAKNLCHSSVLTPSSTALRCVHVRPRLPYASHAQP